MLGGKSISWLRGCSVECGAFERHKRQAPYRGLKVFVRHKYINI